ncbi:peptide deformylase [Siminovitchia sp. FSL H7-0308]|uniref:peptide deformylase n=1 Tax=Siminovitchia sp. FSL H7-0308 TaxID=2921432 RepID=UPI00097E0FD6|nr:peptide deformylase [Bacillus sp. VT-16-64]
MAILPIVCHPNEMLEKSCERVTLFDEALGSLLNDMYETMIAADGVGLAAPQIGVGQQIAIVDIGEEYGNEYIELINPVIVQASGSETDIEGCLSMPGLYGKVPRHRIVVVKAMDRHGQVFSIKAEGFLARALQHEIDHLQGILFTTKVTEYVTESELATLEGSELND